MVDYKQIVKGQLFFFAGILYMLVISYIAPTLIEIGQSLFDNDDVTGISWLIIIFAYVIITIGLPAHFTWKGLTDNKEGTSPVLQSIGAIAMFILGILLTIKGWYIVTTIASALSNDLLALIIFWTGLLISWLLNIIVTPIVVLVRAQQQ